MTQSRDPVLRKIPRQKHSVKEVPDHVRRQDEVEGVDELIENIQNGNRHGDLVLDPNDWYGDDPGELARKIQSGERW